LSRENQTGAAGNMNGKTMIKREFLYLMRPAVFRRDEIWKILWIGSSVTAVKSGSFDERFPL
jgi:hypothetical protein